MLDLASFITNPIATTVMGDYGAEVIKIGPPDEGNPQRKLGQSEFGYYADEIDRLRTVARLADLKGGSHG